MFWKVKMNKDTINLNEKNYIWYSQKCHHDIKYKNLRKEFPFLN